LFLVSMALHNVRTSGVASARSTASQDAVHRVVEDWWRVPVVNVRTAAARYEGVPAPNLPLVSVNTFCTFLPSSTGTWMQGEPVMTREILIL